MNSDQLASRDSSIVQGIRTNIYSLQILRPLSFFRRLNIEAEPDYIGYLQQ